MGRLRGNGGAGWKPASRKRLTNEPPPPLSRFSRSPEPVLVEVSTEDGAHIGSEPGTTNDRGVKIQLQPHPAPRRPIPPPGNSRAKAPFSGFHLFLPQCIQHRQQVKKCCVTGVAEPGLDGYCIVCKVENTHIRNSLLNKASLKEAMDS